MNKIFKYNLSFLFDLGLTNELSALDTVRYRVINIINYIILIGAFLLLVYRIYILDFFSITVNSTLMLLILLNIYFCKKSRHYIAVNLTAIYLLLLAIVLCSRPELFISAVVYLSILPIAFVLLYPEPLGKHLYYLASTSIFTYFGYHLGLDRTIIFTYYIVTFGFYVTFLKFIDLIEQKQQELEEVITKLEAKNAELRQFNYITSHDLQEPLGIINNFSQILSTKYSQALDELGRASLEHIQNASTRMSALIKDLLDYALIGNSDNHEPIIISELFENVKQTLEPVLTTTNTVLTIGKMSTIFGSKAEIQILFQHLITNAIKFRKPDTNPIIKITMEKKGNFWQFSVEDNGIGIAPEYLTKIFNIFQRLHPRNKYKGNGIGLSFCKKIIHLHGGNIWIESELNQGSTIYFTIKEK